MSDRKTELQIQETLSALRQATGLKLCLKIFDTAQAAGTVLGKVSAGCRTHDSSFCTRVKRTRNALCIECDLRRIPTLCQSRRQPFAHTCHAGATEIIVPVFLEDRLVAVAYLGQFRLRKNQPDALPLRPMAEKHNLLGLGQLFRAYLTEQLNAPRFPRETSRGYRSAAIRAYLHKNLSRDPSLSDLGRHLGISPARTAHAVNESTGESFTALRDGLRLERARSLLQTTYLKVAAVATECGFSSSQYFHRFFKQQTGMTPGAFRRRTRPEV